MGDIDKSDAQFFLKFRQNALHAHDEVGIQCTEWFVEQQNTGFCDKRPCQRHPLLLSAGKLADLSVSKVSDFQSFEPVKGALAPFSGRHPAHF